MCSVMHSAETVAQVLELRAQGLGARRIARLTGLSPRTITDWLAGRVPRSAGRGPSCPKCGHDRHRVADLDREAYAYLLAVYLGDGYIASHPRGVYRLRLSLDPRYPAILGECECAIARVLPGSRVARQDRSGPWGTWVEVGAYSKAWPCIFPQHGKGKKHQRSIALADWQQSIVDAHPELFLRGLIHSDGCRFINSGRNGWRHPRDSFSNASHDILGLSCGACETLGLRWTQAKSTIYVSRKADVARMDEFIGPKA
jgi:hypothetical protein